MREDPGFDACGVRVARLPGRGFAGVSTRRIEAGARVLAIPRSRMLTASDARSRASPIGAAASALTEWRALMLALLHERRLGDASAFAPWLALLPDQCEMELHHPLMWDRETRRRVFEAATARGNRGNEHDTKAIAAELSALRAERAALLGYETHAHYVLADETAGSPDAVRAMMGSMTQAVAEKTRAEADELQRHFDEHLPGTELMPWDWAWAAEQVRRARYDLDEGEVRQYFEFERVLTDGLFFMAERLYGVTMHERADLPVYHEDVRVFEVRDEGGEAIALFYADYFARPSKRGGAWMSSFVDQSELLGQLPVVVNVMNIKKPSEGPTLLSFDDVTTMFHEFGHGVHAFEYLAAAWLDLEWHSLAPGEQVDDVDGFERRALEHAGVHMTLVPPRYKSTYFAHIWPGGYSAGYYAYLWSEALAADGFASCAEAGGMSRENGQRFRDAVLSRGFTQEPLEQFRVFRGRELDTNAVLQRRGLVC